MTSRAIGGLVLAVIGIAVLVAGGPLIGSQVALIVGIVLVVVGGCVFLLDGRDP